LKIRSNIISIVKVSALPWSLLDLRLAAHDWWTYWLGQPKPFQPITIYPKIQ